MTATGLRITASVGELLTLIVGIAVWLWSPKKLSG